MDEVEVVTQGATKGSTQLLNTNEIADGFMQVDKVTKSTKGLVVKLQDIGITEDAGINVNMVKVSQKADMELDEEDKRQEEYNQVAFPKKSESLLDFLHMCHKKKSKAMLCPRCSGVFDKKLLKRRNQMNVNNKYTFNKR